MKHNFEIIDIKDFLTEEELESNIYLPEEVLLRMGYCFKELFGNYCSISIYRKRHESGTNPKTSTIYILHDRANVTYIKFKCPIEEWKFGVKYINPLAPMNGK